MLEKMCCLLLSLVLDQRCGVMAWGGAGQAGASRLITVSSFILGLLAGTEKAGGGLRIWKRVSPSERSTCFLLPCSTGSASSCLVCASDIDFSWLVETLIRSVAHQVGSILMFEELLFLKWLLSICLAS